MSMNSESNNATDKVGNSEVAVESNEVVSDNVNGDTTDYGDNVPDGNNEDVGVHVVSVESVIAEKYGDIEEKTNDNDVNSEANDKAGVK